VLDNLALVESYPALDHKAEISNWEEQAGGPAATAMATVAKLGVSAGLAGIIGDDEAGGKIRRLLSFAGVDLHLVKRRGGRSQVAFIAIDQATGKRTIFWRRAVGRELQYAELPAGFPREIRFPSPGRTHAKCFACVRQKQPRAAGVPVMLDASRIRANTLAIVNQCDFLVGSEHFARQFGWNGDGHRIGQAFRDKVRSFGFFVLRPLRLATEEALRSPRTACFKRRRSR